MEPDENVYYWLGTFYRYGYNVVDIDLQKAVSWYRKALLVHPNSSIVEKAIKEIENETKVP
jgi:TPR repeat protein